MKRVTIFFHFIIHFTIVYSVIAFYAALNTTPHYVVIVVHDIHDIQNNGTARFLYHRECWGYPVHPLRSSTAHWSSCLALWHSSYAQAGNRPLGWVGKPFRLSSHILSRCYWPGCGRCGSRAISWGHVCKLAAGRGSVQCASQFTRVKHGRPFRCKGTTSKDCWVLCRLHTTT